MPFRFTLQTILRLRESYERLERMRLLNIAALIVKTREEISALETEAVEARMRIGKSLARGIPAAEMHFELICEKVRAQQKRLLLARLAELERKREEQRRAYLSAKQKKEILESLRERQQREYRIEQGRREQITLDEMHLLRRGTSDSD